MTAVLIFDGHLDLAMNALSYERDITAPLAVIREREADGVPDDRGTAGLTLDEMRRGGVGLCTATLIARAKPWVPANRKFSRSHGDWPTQAMAYAVAHSHLAYYRLLERQGHLRIIESAMDLEEHTLAWRGGKTHAIGVIITLEGADPIVEPEQLRQWYVHGLRTLMLAHFGVSHYAGGTPSTDPANTRDVDRPLTDMGHALLEVMAELKMPLDLTHTSDLSFADAVASFGGAIYSSHSGCRTLSDEQRNHTDEQLRTIIVRDGVIGVPLYNGFLEPGYHARAAAAAPIPVSLERVAEHVDHICQLAGDANHAAIGSDLDGGFGIEHTPDQIDTMADVPRVAAVLEARGYGDRDIEAIMAGNWLRFFAANLPAADTSQDEL